MESLTPRPGIREQNRPLSTDCIICATRKSDPATGTLQAPQFVGLVGSPTTTKRAQYFGSAHSGCCALLIIANIDFCSASAWES